jgi:hypothetical protein
MTNDNIIRLKTMKILVTDEEVDRDKLGSTDEADGLPTQVLTTTSMSKFAQAPVRPGRASRSFSAAYCCKRSVEIPWPPVGGTQRRE